MLPICLVGCGGMGIRHLRGYGALDRVGQRNLDVVAVCDLDESAALRAAAEAERLLGRRPAVHTRPDTAIVDPAVAAFDVVTDPATHHLIAEPALRAGKHVLCEKPLGITVRAARAMIEAANAGGAVLATAENYRRGNANRVAKAVTDTGLLGVVHLMIEMHIGGDDRVIITPWRHEKRRGTIALDMAIHFADIIQYLFGEVETAFGRGLIAQPVRRAADGTLVPATGEDSLIAQLITKSGVLVHLDYLPSGPGRRYTQRTVHGRNGSMRLPSDRSGAALEVQFEEDVLSGARLIDALGTEPVDDLARALFRSRLAEYELSFEESDAAHLAVELHDFAGAILEGRSPEVDGAGGLAALAAIYAILESGVSGQAVRVDDVATGKVHTYQDDIDEVLGL